MLVRVSNSKLKNKTLNVELLTRSLNFCCFAFKLLTQRWKKNSLRVSKSIGKRLLFRLQVTNLKLKNIKLYLKLLTGKLKKMLFRILVIRDLFIEMIYYVIHNIWKNIGKLNFVIIDVDLVLKRLLFMIMTLLSTWTGFYYVLLYLACFVLSTYLIFIWVWWSPIRHSVAVSQRRNDHMQVYITIMESK